MFTGQNSQGMAPLAAGSNRISRSLESIVSDLDPRVERAGDANAPGNPSAHGPRIETLERRLNELNTGTALGFEHISDRLRRIESALGL